MNLHTERWEEAQKKEAEYWKQESFRDSEFKELVTKYSKLFARIEKDYYFDDSFKILDLGCGATCPSILFTRGKKYGVDPLAGSFLQTDKEKLDGKINLSEGRGEEIPFADDYFDVILCRNALDHMDNLQEVFSEMKRVAKENAVIILSVYVYAPFIFFLKTTTEHIPFLRNIEHPFTFTQGRFRKLCEKDFEILEEQIIFEGKNSIDYGKQDVHMSEPLLNKVIAWLNRYVFLSDWFLREYLLICRSRT
ncbi:MAG: class I SAM-dependent methyltransferase [Actinomycetota bacterium]